MGPFLALFCSYRFNLLCLQLPLSAASSAQTENPFREVWWDLGASFPRPSALLPGSNRFSSYVAFVSVAAVFTDFAEPPLVVQDLWRSFADSFPSASNLGVRALPGSCLPLIPLVGA